MQINDLFGTAAAFETVRMPDARKRPFQQNMPQLSM